MVPRILHRATELRVGISVPREAVLRWGGAGGGGGTKEWLRAATPWWHEGGTGRHRAARGRHGVRWLVVGCWCQLALENRSPVALTSVVMLWTVVQRTTRFW